jgi:aldose 1-epimerase
LTLVPSGEQFEIARGPQRATIVEVGGGIRSYEVDSRPVLDPYDLHEMCDGAHGEPLVPWPNRLADGQYRFDGNEYQLALTEPAQRNAIHGLLRWWLWRAREHEPDRVVIGTRLYPLQGYPFALDVAIAYELTDAGLRVHTSVTNIGDRACPFGSGHHPYLSPGTGRLDDCELRFDAQTRILTDERQIPAGDEPVAGTPVDFKAGRRIGVLEIDDAFTGLGRDDAGRATVTLTGPDGAAVELWADRSYEVIQLYTGHTLAPGRRRLGLAAEPMTCPANAFQNGDRVVRIEPGETVASVWGVGLR